MKAEELPRAIPGQPRNEPRGISRIGRMDPGNRITMLERNQERIFRAFSRLGLWECHCCGEIQPRNAFSAFGFCFDCWQGRDDLEEMGFNFEGVPDDEVARVCLGWYRDSDFFGNWAGQRPASQVDLMNGPGCVGHLLSAYCWFGKARVNRLIARRARVDLVLDVVAIRWVRGLGWVLRFLPKAEWPQPDHPVKWRNDWAKLYRETLTLIER